MVLGTVWTGDFLMAETFIQRGANSLQSSGAGLATGLSQEPSVFVARFGGAIPFTSDTRNSHVPGDYNHYPTVAFPPAGSGSNFGFGQLTFGKFDNSSLGEELYIVRSRIVQFWQITNYPAGTRFELRLTVPSWGNDLEPWIPEVRFYNSAFTTWDNMLGAVVGQLPFGVHAGTLSIPEATLSPFYGSTFALIVGNQLEFNNAGAAGSQFTSGRKSEAQLGTPVFNQSPLNIAVL